MAILDFQRCSWIFGTQRMYLTLTFKLSALILKFCQWATTTTVVTDITFDIYGMTWTCNFTFSYAGKRWYFIDSDSFLLLHWMTHLPKTSAKIVPRVILFCRCHSLAQKPLGTRMSHTGSICQTKERLHAGYLIMIHLQVMCLNMFPIVIQVNSLLCLWNPQA